MSLGRKALTTNSSSLVIPFSEGTKLIKILIVDIIIPMMIVDISSLHSKSLFFAAYKLQIHISIINNLYIYGSV